MTALLTVLVLGLLAEGLLIAWVYERKVRRLERKLVEAREQTLQAHELGRASARVAWRQRWSA